MMDVYDIDFITIIQHDIYVRAFGEITIFLFHYVIWRLCDGAGVLEILKVNERVQETNIRLTKTMKDLAYLILLRRPRDLSTAP